MLFLCGLVCCSSLVWADDPIPDWVNQVVVDRAAADWNWGELYYGETYETVLKVTNDCPQPRKIKVVIGKPLRRYLVIKGHKKPIPAKAKEHPLKITIKTPAQPKKSPKFDPRFDYLVFPNDKVEILHEKMGNCRAVYTEYHVSGHAHVKPPSGGRPLQQDLCRVWWNTLERPDALPEDEDCVDEFRAMATHIVEVILPIYVSHAPDDWSWLPSVAEIQEMSSPALLIMKARADALINK